MHVMHKRLCGTPRSGLYAVGEVSSNGSLLAFTALAAPVPAEIQNPRAAEKVHLRFTLNAGLGLVPPGPGLMDLPFAGLPLVGMADLWGKASGYETVSDVVGETLNKGIARRIPAVPDVSLPCPILMMHMDAHFYAVREGWQERVIRFVNEWEPLWAIQCNVEDQPWRDAPSLGRSGDDMYLWHPYMAFWQALSDIGGPTERERSVADMGGRMAQGIFGLTWVTKFVQVLRQDQDHVDEKYARQGVLPALSPDDPRAKDADNV